ncbi:Oidioi.mRNA.OKI2018_I69.chr1.g3885.t1.cds [Oikopleura dioica]|uniref:Oidioi.mRNA.OKI2018_I69.chr1.g3885.t1.cds n=1 Tax=Oikopleura dioica TaxID=34765 RepID=A0ABN7T2B7_OIKDI|nr:Oidioi.mRNA.OKI2018_I69.chr1.g3885.t1.cds [Oikopleura dioica]
MKLSFLFASSALAANTRGTNGDAAELKKNGLTTEILHFKVHGKDVDKWNELDDEIWTTYLAKQDGFVRKTTNVDRTCDFTKASNCDVYSHVDWETFDQWKAIDEKELNDKTKEFDDACEAAGITQKMENAVPLGTTGLAVIASTSSAASVTGALFALVSSLALFHL